MDSVVDLLRQLVAIPSVSPMGRDLTGPEYFEENLSNYLCEFFESLGVPFERIEVLPKRANVIARYDAPQSDFTLLMDAHQDTVPVDGMTIDPFDPVVRDGRVWGRGTTDVKGGMAAMLHAFQRLVKEKPVDSVNVIMSCTCDEEATTRGITDLVNYWINPGRSQLVTTAPDAALISEPTELDVVVAHRGAVRFCIHTTGRACHSSAPERGVNAIYAMSRVLQVLQEYAESLKQSTICHPRVGRPTASVGLISGGSSVNIVPDCCTIEIDRRAIPGESPTDVFNEVKQFVEERVQDEVIFDQPYLEGPPLGDDNNSELADSLLKSIESVDGPHQAIGVPFGTHASRTYDGGVPSVVFGPGSVDQAHIKDEFIEIEQLEKAAEVYYRFAASLGGN